MQSHAILCNPMQSHAVPCNPMQSHTGCSTSGLAEQEQLPLAPSILCTQELLGAHVLFVTCGVTLVNDKHQPSSCSLLPFWLLQSVSSEPREEEGSDPWLRALSVPHQPERTAVTPSSGSTASTCFSSSLPPNLTFSLGQGSAMCTQQSSSLRHWHHWTSQIFLFLSRPSYPSPLFIS